MFLLLQVGAACAQDGFGPLRFSGSHLEDHDAALVRVSSPPSVLKALAPPPGTSSVGTHVCLGWVRVIFRFSREVSFVVRVWTPLVVESRRSRFSRSNGTLGSRPIGLRSGRFLDGTLGQPTLPVLLVVFENPHHIHFRAF